MLISEASPSEIYAAILVASPDQLREYAKLLDSKSDNPFRIPGSGHFQPQWLDYFFKTIRYFRFRIMRPNMPTSRKTFDLLVDLTRKRELAHKLIAQLYTEEEWNKLIDLKLSRWEEPVPQEFSDMPREFFNKPFPW